MISVNLDTRKMILTVWMHMPWLKILNARPRFLIDRSITSTKWNINWRLQFWIEGWAIKSQDSQHSQKGLDNMNFIRCVLDYHWHSCMVYSSWVNSIIDSQLPSRCCWCSPFGQSQRRRFCTPTSPLHNKTANVFVLVSVHLANAANASAAADANLCVILD